MPECAFVLVCFGASALFTDGKMRIIKIFVAVSILFSVKPFISQFLKLFHLWIWSHLLLRIGLPVINQEQPGKHLGLHC